MGDPVVNSVTGSFASPVASRGRAFIEHVSSVSCTSLKTYSVGETHTLRWAFDDVVKGERDGVWPRGDRRWAYSELNAQAARPAVFVKSLARPTLLGIE